MNERERFLATMHYQPRDRAPICDFNYWDETLPLWHEQGLPAHVTRENSDDFFGLDRLLNDGGTSTGVTADLAPAFEEKVIEDRGDHEVVQQSDGVRVLRRKVMSSIPQHLGHLLTDRASWQEHYKPRLDPANPARYPVDWDARVVQWRDPARDLPLILPGGSLFGRIRDWLGLENVAMVLYDDPVWFEEMVETLADCIIGTLTRLLETGAQFDACSMWEDMAYKAGPLISPTHFERYLVPHYRRISDLVRSYGVDVIYLDCDGKIDKLVPLWLEAGINCMFPIEVGTWGADPVKFRQEYGQDLLLMGGFDKKILARSKAEIEAEVRRLAPLVEEGGFIGFCDHRVPPDVPYENYLFYVQTVRHIWGQDTNLRPIGV